jgi:hypothetical protein
MFVAPAVAAAVVISSTTAALRSHAVGRVGSATFASGIIAGLIGFGFHLRNTSRRVGGWTVSSNVFYGAPAAAPLALTMAGLVGSIASRLGERPTVERRESYAVAGLAVAGLAGTAMEAGALHFRGAFQNPLMYSPVVLPPIAAATLATAVLSQSVSAKRVATASLQLTAWLGVAGTCLHAWGMHRRMGGWRNWRQNLFAGPPLPAPPAFTALSLAGLAGLQLVESSGPR